MLQHEDNLVLEMPTPNDIYFYLNKKLLTSLHLAFNLSKLFIVRVYPSIQVHFVHQHHNLKSSYKEWHKSCR